MKRTFLFFLLVLVVLVALRRIAPASHPNAAPTLREGHPSAAAALGTPPSQRPVSPSSRGLRPALDDTSLLPPDGFLGPWKKVDPPKRFTQANLYGYIDGGAELFLEYGFERLTVQKYRNGADELTIEAYRMTDPTAATGIYLMKAGKEAPAAGFKERHTANRYQLMFCRNRYYVIVNNLSGREAFARAQVNFASYIAPRLPSASPIAELRALPREGLVAGSARLVRGPYALQAIYTLGSGDILSLRHKLTAATGDYASANGTYTLIAATYPDAAQAKRAFAHMQKNLDRYLKVIEQKPDRFVFEDYSKKYGVVSVVGRRLEARVKLAQKP